ncbi:SAC3 family protein B isoform X2 [Humulus lupulus]|uniref:SAC3 family protein B isoform X2 n=1 Tax=Humulus lupulus TaxID=3486 RepID=UPI002B414ECF|nr:SAC3 family protein B isoform X2 [Humulus lupulus]
MAYSGFGKQSGPAIGGGRPKSPPLFGNVVRPPSPSPSPPIPPFFNPVPVQSPRPVESRAPPIWGDGQRPFYQKNDAQFNQRPSLVTSIVASGNSDNSVSFKVSRSQDSRRTNTSAMPRRNNVSNEGFRPSFAGPGPGPVRHFIPPRTNSTELVSRSSLQVFRPSYAQAATPVRPAPFSHSFDGQAKSPVNFRAVQPQSLLSPYTSSYDSERSRFEDVQVTNRKRYPAPPLANEVLPEHSHFPQNNSNRPSSSPPPALGAISNVDYSTHDSQAPRKLLARANNTHSAAATNSTSLPVMKRSRSPALHSSDEVTEGNMYASEDAEREIQAKAKRLARFKVELGDKMQSSNDTAEKKVSTERHELSVLGRNRLVPEHSTELAEDVASGSTLSEYESSGHSSVIVGLCTDMCPESERAERERKGDLDRFERLDGDRNQTSKYLAVKKYNRTAEREANLIRPMHVLQETIVYLLNLLDQPYNDRFLGMYNFLWDRMRAIRMDLRMQHIFNQGAISMLEQMIRLHVIAMHELCEYSKGEGFSEGFDAHLNIEQMNKTSVELFQMYDDHRKKGISIPTEKEFRGYYALLKLDKHPGYIVEPAELSLDLAKMTPEIRQTKEVLFARDVARACRTGNFIAFFRLARKASYLQACLMHAHFAKLRTQALASLHAGLQNNQGLPVMHVAKWLAMEEEDMESLLEYHGFLIKVFDEPYMVKEGPFLNGDKDYPTRCSKLVDMKKSGLIMDDVLPSIEVISPTKAPKVQIAEPTKSKLKVSAIGERERPVHDIPSASVLSPKPAVDEEMGDFELVSPQKEHKQTKLRTEIPIVSVQREDEPKVVGFNPLLWGFSIPKPLPSKVSNESKSNYETSLNIPPQRNLFQIEEPHRVGTSNQMALQLVSQTASQDRLLNAPFKCAEENSLPRSLVNKVEEEEPFHVLQEDGSEEVMENYQDEVAEAKLKLLLRLWRRRTSRKRELREQRQSAANAALYSLPLGPPVQLKRDPPSASGGFDIDLALRERYRKHKESWSRLNVSEEIAAILNRRNPDAKCLCWKIIVCSPKSNPESEVRKRSQPSHSSTSPWLISKLMPSRVDYDDDDDLVVSFPGLSIWKKWVPGESCTDLTCCLSVVKDANSNDLIETVSGASAVLFLVCDSIPWNLQKANLHKLIMSIPSGSCLPLLILSSPYKDEVSDLTSVMVNELGLFNIDKSRISSFLVVSLIEDKQMECLDGFLSDTRLREGLKWLASESPPQVVLRCIKTRELVLTHLIPSLEALDRISNNEVNPNSFVIAFNEALDKSIVDIDTAAKANHTSWPSPEIALLEAFSYEHRIVEECVPGVGWSSMERIEPLMSALHDCKLPFFHDDLSYLAKGTNTDREIKIHREEFGKSLIRYLAESGIGLAINEASIMLQSSLLELCGSCYRIVPDWVMIFKRIFNWRLMGISNGAFSLAYVLERPDVCPAFGDLGKLGLEGSRLSPYYVNRPSLDEMIEVSCGPLPFNNGQSVGEANQPLPQITTYGGGQEPADTSDFMEDNSGFDQDHRIVIADTTVREAGGTGKLNAEAENLSKLLEKCNILQNMIDDKLSVYF